MTIKPQAGAPLPQIEVHMLEENKIPLGGDQTSDKWRLIVVYRGMHCPICKKYIGKLNELASRYNESNVDILTISTDPAHKAAEFARDLSLSIPVAYGLSIEDAQKWGLYISKPRSSQETDAPFAEPGLYLVRPDGRLQIVDISNAPFSRPDLEGLLGGIQFIQKNDYPVRGTV